MTTENFQAIVDVIDATEERLLALADRLRDQPDTHLLEGDWTVRDTLCHLAARANDVPLVLRLADQLSNTGSRPPMEIDTVNAQQIAGRAGRTVDELLKEASDGYAAARVAVVSLSIEQLMHLIPDVAGRGPMTIGDLLLLVYQGHAQGHIATIEDALTRK